MYGDEAIEFVLKFGEIESEVAETTLVRTSLPSLMVSDLVSPESGGASFIFTEVVVFNKANKRLMFSYQDRFIELIFMLLLL